MLKLKGNKSPTQKKLSSNVVHANDGQNIAGYSSSNGYERIHEDGTLNGVVTQVFMAVGTRSYDKLCYLADGRFFSRMNPVEFVESIEKFRKPHHQSIVPEKTKRNAAVGTGSTKPKDVRIAHPMWNVKLIVIEIIVNLSIGLRKSCLLFSIISDSMSFT